MATGYFWSIVAMMSAPFLICGAVGFVIWRAMRRS